MSVGLKGDSAEGGLGKIHVSQAGFLMNPSRQACGLKQRELDAESTSLGCKLDSPSFRHTVFKNGRHTD